MAKSIRSKSKIRNRNALRATVFGPHEAERIKRLAEKQRITSGTTNDLMDTTKDEPAKTEDVDMEAKPVSTKRVNKRKQKQQQQKKKKGFHWVKQKLYKR
ncbi:hypothetical protein GGF46_001977 [Coemansia sp. RSA 552]|nr:hypothetical protein GGF46_001977 [Coemansia sp. RSA 552]